MIYVIAAALVLFNTFCLLLVLLRLPGVWLMVFCTGLVAWWQWDEGMFSPWTLAAILLLAFISEVLELIAGAAGTRQMGGSRWGAFVALFGAIGGAVAGTVLIPIPPLGSIIGAIGGAALAAWVAELIIGRKMHEAMRSGAGAGIGTLAGMLVKLGIGALVWFIIAVAAFWP